ncbi:MAG TPA: alkaline phosphatase family protein [Candidatus Bathyarchaeia archaeon]|nr:alkaline phosphatase family protein [Candidatus Bathyarchaeia archaeon]
MGAKRNGLMAGPRALRGQRVLVIGLDCAAPRFVFGPDPFRLPNIRRLAERGCWGRLRSCDPPITAPAWACMMSGKDPGTLGCYGFRNRTDYSYAGMAIANAAAIREKRVWDIVSRVGKKVVVLGVPQTYPVAPVNGWLVADFLAPDTHAEFTYPRGLRDELQKAVGEYILDVEDFRTDDKPALLERIYALMHNRFDAALYLMKSKPWDFFMMVEMGVDRLHHGFWKYCDPEHPKFEPNNPFVDAFRGYYEALDVRIGELLELAGDETAVLVVSDHGAKAMQGGLCLNQWLINEGFLTLKERGNCGNCGAGVSDAHLPPALDASQVDWSKTKAWGAGGYYGRVFINVAGREPEGIVRLAEYESFREELAGRIRAIPGPMGYPLGNVVLKPQDVYREVRGIPPDLMVYFGDLDWRAVGSIGHRSIFTYENDTGPDDANHDYDGIFIMDDGTGRRGRQLHKLRIVDVAPTLLALMGIEPPSDMQGRPIC